MAFLAVSAIKQNNLANSVGGARPHASIMRYMFEADQTEQRATAATWDTQEGWLLRSIPPWVLYSSREFKGHQKVHAAEAVQERIVTEAPTDDNGPVAPAPTLPSQAKVNKTAKVVPTQGTAALNETLGLARSRGKVRIKNRTSPENQTTTMPTRRQKKRIRRKYWRPS